MSSAFVLGNLLADYDAKRLLARVQALQIERDRLTERLAAERADRMKLERSHQIDVEAQRSAQRQIAELEHDRMELERRLAQVNVMVAASGRGVVDVRDVSVRPKQDDVYAYRFVVAQLVPDFGVAEGEAVLSLVGDRNDASKVTQLTDLAEDGSGRHQLSFEHSGVVEGRFRLPQDAEPRDLVVEILPKGDTFIGTKRVVGWGLAIGAAEALNGLGADRLAVGRSHLSE